MAALHRCLQKGLGTMNFKKQLLWIVPVIALVAFVGYFLMKPIGALRLNIISMGHPISAFTFTVMDAPLYEFGAGGENKFCYSLENPPFEKETQSELVNWVVTKYGVFYLADYYGCGSCIQVLTFAAALSLIVEISIGFLL